MTFETINKQFSSLLKEKVKDKFTYDSWFKEISIINIDDKKAYISVKNSFAKKLLTKTYYKLVSEVADIVFNKKLNLVFIENDSSEIEKITYRVKASNFTNNNLNPKYIFDDFVVGDACERPLLKDVRCTSYIKKIMIFKNRL